MKKEDLLKRLHTLEECFRALNFEQLVPLLSENVRLESQELSQPVIGIQAVANFCSGKGRPVRISDLETVQITEKTDEADLIDTSKERYALRVSGQADGESIEILVELKLDEEDRIAEIKILRSEETEFARLENEKAQEKKEENPEDGEGNPEDEDEEDEEDEDEDEDLFEEPDDEEIESYLREQLEDNPDDFSEIEDYILRVDDYYSGDLEEFTFREAIRMGATCYVEEHIYDYDLNDAGQYSTYLQEADDPKMRGILIDHGALRPETEYMKFPFAYETENGTIYAFDMAFRREVFEQYLQYTGLTEEKVIEMLSEGYDEEADEDLPEDLDRDVGEDCATLGISLLNGKLHYKEDMYGEDGDAAQELLEELGWECIFEGDESEMIGVNLIE